MKLRKILSMLLSLCMIAGMCVMPHPASAADNPSYLLKGEVSGRSFVVQVYLQNALSYGGRLAIAYDSDVLEIADTSFEKAVKQASGVTVTNEGHDDSVLLGGGHVMFAWYATRYAGLDASSGDKPVATVRFDFVNGASASDFNRNTLGLYYVNETMVYGWDCSSEIIANTNGKLKAYRNTEINEAYLCGLNRDYTRCEVIPVITYNVSINVRNADGKEIASTVMLDNIAGETDSYGHIDYKMQSGTYFYRITSPGYELKMGYFIVGEQDETFNVRLRSYGQLANDVADEIEIGYAEGDYAGSVTTDLVLPTESKYGTISWTSDNGAVSEYGGVSRGEDDIPVTLTATVTVGTATATRDFDVVIKSRLTAEEKNQAIVSQDKADLAIVYAPGDSDDYVTAGLLLPETGAKGSSIIWGSSDENIISYTGSVIRPENDTEVTLTAYIIRGTVSDTKTFTVIVKGTGKLTPIPTEEPEETPVPPVINEPVDVSKGTGKSTPIPTEEPEETPVLPVINEPVDVSKGTGKSTPIPTEEPEEPDDIGEIPEETPVPPIINEPVDVSNEIVQRIINALEIGYAKDDSAESVTEKLTLPSVGTEGTTITWTSSLPAVITPYGGVVRQAEDAKVTLTATVLRGEVSAQKTFTVMVKAAEEIPENPNNGQEAEIAEKNSNRRGGGRSSTTETANGGGGADTETAKSTEPTPTSNLAPAEKDTEKTATERKQFIDIDNVPWAENAINALAERGVINGTGDDTYSPNNNIRRADFVMLLMKLYELDTEITDTFDDVAADKYYYSDVSKAKSLGIISGIDETHFNPDGSISRQDMMTMTYRALKQLGKADNLTEADLSVFNDADDVSDYATESVKCLVGGGYIHGDTEGNLNPLLNTTRAETAVFMYGLVY